MKVFISYSVKDLRLVGFIADQIRPHAEPVYWTQNQAPGHDAWRTIFDWIDTADCVIAVITDAVVERGESVNQEIGFAKGKGKLVIPLVAPRCRRTAWGATASHSPSIATASRDDGPPLLALGEAATKQKNAWITRDRRSHPVFRR